MAYNLFFYFQYTHEDDILPPLTVAVGSSKDFHVRVIITKTGLGRKQGGGWSKHLDLT